MKSEKTELKISILLIALFIAGLIPIFLLGRYDYQSADDYGFSANNHVAWMQSHSVIQVLKGAGETAIELWHRWQGTFSSIFLMSLQPGIWGMYSLVPWIMIGAMTFSTLFFFYVVFRKFIQVRPAIFLSISMIYLIFALECMIDKTQGFFWFNGAAHYMIPHSVALCLFTVLILMMTEEKKTLRRMVAACFLAAFTGGANYITALITLILFVSAIALLLFMKQKQKCRLLILPFLLFLAAFLLNVLAPGNAVRQEVMTVRPGVIKSILLSFYYCVEYMVDTWFNWTYFLFVFALLPFLWETVKAFGKRFSYPAPFLVFAYSYCVLSAMFTPTLFAGGDAGGGRIFNIMFLDFMILTILNIFYFMGWLYRKLGFAEHVSGSCLEKADVKWYLLAVLCFGIFIGAMYTKVNPDYFTSTSALYSLMTKEGWNYGRETAERDDLLKQAVESDTADITIPRLTVHPYLLFWSDIEEDADDYTNKSMARYYGKDSIRGIEK